MTIKKKNNKEKADSICRANKGEKRVLRKYAKNKGKHSIQVVFDVVFPFGNWLYISLTIRLLSNDNDCVTRNVLQRLRHAP